MKGAFQKEFNVPNILSTSSKTSFVAFLESTIRKWVSVGFSTYTGGMTLSKNVEQTG
jgi:hypothetical protein